MAKQGYQRAESRPHDIQRLLVVQIDMLEALDSLVPAAEVDQFPGVPGQERDLPDAIPGAARELQPLTAELEHFLESIDLAGGRAQVVVGADRRCGQVVLERDLQRSTQQDDALLEAAPRGKDQSLRVHRLRHDLRKTQTLGDVEGELDPL